MEKKIKILFAINCMNIGGAPSVVFHQIKLLDKQRFEPHLLLLYPSKPANFLSQIDFIPTTHITQYRLKKRSVFDVVTLWKIYQELRREKYDVVYTHLFLANFLVRSLAIFARIKTIIAFEHSTYFNKSDWQIRMDRLLAHFTDRIVVSTESVRDFTVEQEQIEKEKFVVIRNPVVIPEKGEVDQPSAREFARIEKKHMPIFLTIGRYSPEKGQLVLLHAARMVHEKYPDALFVLVGHGAQEDELREFVLEHAMDEYVRILHAPHRAKEYLFIADWFVLPSLREGQSIVVEEAMTAGLPVVASKLPGMGNIVVEGENGFLATPNDPDDLARVLAKAVAVGEKRRDLSFAAYEKARTQFSSVDRVKKFEQLCFEIVAAKES